MSEAAPSPEDEARANCYGLLARLFYGPPDAQLLHALAENDLIAAEDPGSALARAARDLRQAAAATDVESAREEFESVFVGTGRAEVSLYAGAYLTHMSLDQPLVEIREFLASQGLARKGNVQEPEDHIAALCDAMRYLVARTDPGTQRAFFERFVFPAAVPLCNAVIQCMRVNFYRHVAAFLKALAELEHSAFDMD